MSILKKHAVISDTIKILLYKENATLFDKLDFDDNAAFLEPLLFTCLNSQEEVLFSNEILEEILQGYYTNKEALKTNYIFNKAGVAYIPNLGYYKKDSKQLYLPIEIIKNTTIEIVKHSHPLIDRVFESASGNTTGESDIKIDDDVYNKNIEFLSNAFHFIKLASKEHYNLIEQCCRKVILFKTDPENTNSFATIKAHGIAFINVYQEDYDAVFFVDDIAHQTGHIILTTLLFERKKYFLIDENENISSMTKKEDEYRSFYTLFHALYTYYSSLLCLNNAIEFKCFNSRQMHEAKGRIGFYIKKCTSDMENFKKVIDHYGGLENVLTNAGIQLFNLINGKFTVLIPKWYLITKQYNYNNQPYNFTYQKFTKLNPIKND